MRDRHTLLPLPCCSAFFPESERRVLASLPASLPAARNRSKRTRWRCQLLQPDATYATIVATRLCACTFSFGQQGTEKYRNATFTRGLPPHSQALALPTSSSCCSSSNSQQQPGHKPIVWDSSAWFGKSLKGKKIATVSLFTQGRKADQARSSQAQGTALPLGKRNSLHDSPAMATLRFSFYLHGEATPTLPSSKTPLSEELPRLVHNRPGHHPKLVHVSRR